MFPPVDLCVAETESASSELLSSPEKYAILCVGECRGEYLCLRLVPSQRQSVGLDSGTWHAALLTCVCVDLSYE